MAASLFQMVEWGGWAQFFDILPNFKAAWETIKDEQAMNEQNRREGSRTTNQGLKLKPGLTVMRRL